MIDTTQFKAVNDRRTGTHFETDFDGFRITIRWDHDDFLLNDFGEFCERERPPRWATSETMLVRNPDAWRKLESGEWERTTTRTFGWFALCQHPSEFIEQMREGSGYTQKEAWTEVMQNIRERIRKYGRGELFAFRVIVEASKAGVRLSRFSFGGFEAEDYIKEEDVKAAVFEHSMIEQSVEIAKQKLVELCNCNHGHA